MMRPTSLSLQFGATAKPLMTQLREQGAAADANDVLHWQQDADAITRLNVRLILPDADTRKARQRLLRLIAGGLS